MSSGSSNVAALMNVAWAGQSLAWHLCGCRDQRAEQLPALDHVAGRERLANSKNVPCGGSG
jgi:hypothetical protein